MNKYIVITLLSLLSLGSFTEELVSDTFDPEETILFWSEEEKINGFKNGYNYIPSRTIKKSSNPYPLNSLLLDFSKVSYKLKNKTFTLDDYINKFNGK